MGTFVSAPDGRDTELDESVCTRGILISAHVLNSANSLLTQYVKMQQGPVIPQDPATGPSQL